MIEPRMYASKSVGASAEIVDLTNIRHPYSIQVSPGSGNTSKVELSLTQGAASNPGTAVWVTWFFGTVSAPTLGVFDGPLTAVRFTRVSGSSTDTAEVLA